MSDRTKIEWTDATVNAINGCSVLSPGCTHCYAMRLAGTRMRSHPSRIGLTQPSKAGPVWTGEVRLNEKALLDPLRWKRPRRIFWNAHGDTFHDAVPDDWIDRMFAVMALTPQHSHQVLTKRSARMRGYCSDPETPARIYDLVCNWALDGIGDIVLIAPGFELAGAPKGRHVHLGLWPLPNVWFGVSIEDQTRKTRIDELRETPAAMRFISAEPLLEDLGAVDLTGIDWAIVGGESGPDARPMHPHWARSLRDQCADAAVPFLFKQWGEYRPSDACQINCNAPDTVIYDKAAKVWRESIDGGWIGDTAMCRVGKKKAGRQLDGQLHDGFPA